MCVICISKAGVNQPSKELLKMMWDRNPHGAGYMYSKSKYVYIRKGFMTFDSFYKAIKAENFSKYDTVVYHFRISTQGGVNPEMTHPFILTDDINKTKILKTRVNVGICHNGVIGMTSGPNKEYSDTAIFIAKYLSKLVTKPSDLKNPQLCKTIEYMIGSKMAILDYAGNVTTIGSFVRDTTGLMYSNTYFLPYKYRYAS